MTTKMTRTLPVKLTSDEVEVKTKELTKALVDYDVLEEEKKATSKRLGDQMKEMRAKFTDLARIVSTGKEDREVEVYRSANLPRKVFEIVRTDTNEVIEQVAMSQYEIDEQRQLDLTMMPAAAPKPRVGSGSPKA